MLRMISWLKESFLRYITDWRIIILSLLAIVLIFVRPILAFVKILISITKKLLEGNRFFWLIIILQLLALLVPTYFAFHNISGLNTFPFIRYAFKAFVILLPAIFFVSAFGVEKKLDSNQLIAWIYLVLLNFGAFGIIELYNPKTGGLPLPDLPAGTVGFRAWGSDILFKKIQIFFLDKDGTWHEVPRAVVDDSSNWCRGMWKASTEISRKRGFLKDPPSSNFSTKNDTELGKNTLVIELQNCGAVFDAKEVFPAGGCKNIKLHATIEYKRLDAKGDTATPDCQLCLGVPFPPDSLELYYGYSLQFIHPEWAKMWIPALEWQPFPIHKDPISLLKQQGRLDKIELNKEYELIAILFNGYVRFLERNPKNGWVVVLYEGKVEKLVNPVEYPIILPPGRYSPPQDNDSLSERSTKGIKLETPDSDSGSPKGQASSE